jgi:pimeloyl-ACP methyl ester carboxylesterase
VRPRRLAALIAAAVLAAGCGAPAGEPDGGRDTGGRDAASSPAAPAATAPSPGLQRYYDQRPDWTDCGQGFQCARIAVPLDYDDPDGEQIEISVVRLPATGDRIGSLLVNPGGPGGSGIEYARQAEYIVSKEVRARFDIVGFDPRGVGESSPVRCLSGPELDRHVGLDATPDEEAEIRELERSARAFAEGCQAKSGKLLPHVGTADAARDMDVLRAVLGDEGLTYLGKSYGTFLGAMYAHLFPDKVRALVLDGAVNPALDPLESNEAQAQGFEVALEAFLKDCLADASCPFRSRDLDGALQEFTELMRRIDARPLPNRTDRRPVTEAWAMLGVATPLYDRGSWPVLRQAIAQALEGDGTTLITTADILIGRRPDGTYTNQTEANTAINCVDRVYPRDLAAYRRAAEATKSPRFGAYIAWGSLPCAYWPVKGDDTGRRITADGAPPIVVIGTTRDPATPYEWSQALSTQLKSGRLITYEGDGHTAYKTGSQCVDRLVDRYLISGTPPDDGARCAANE